MLHEKEPVRMRKLSDSEILQIQEGTEYLLENVGFIVESEQILSLAKKAGAIVDEAGARIKFPKELLRELIAMAPRQYVISSLDGRDHLRGGDVRGFSAIVTDPWIIDYETQNPRRPTLNDVRKHTIIGQKMERVVQMSRMDFPVTDYEGETSSLRALETHLLNQNKHVLFMPATLENYYEFKNIARILANGGDPGEKKILSVAVAVVSPFKLGGWNAEMLVDAIKSNYVITTTVCPMAGTTSPFNKVGTLLQANAESLFMIALTQMIQPGTPINHGFGASVTDMHAGHDRYYTLDTALWTLAKNQLAQAYGLPAVAACGGSMTHRYDQQSGAEGMAFMQAAYHTGSDLLSGIGSCYNAIGMSAEMMLIQDAWFDAVEFLAQGIDFTDLERAKESLEAIGPGGNFLTEDITIENLRSNEFFRDELFDYSGGNCPGRSLLQNAHERIEAMVAGFESPLPQSVQEELRKYFYDRYYV